MGAREEEGGELAFSPVLYGKEEGGKGSGKGVGGKGKGGPKKNVFGIKGKGGKGKGIKIEGDLEGLEVVMSDGEGEFLLPPSSSPRSPSPDHSPRTPRSSRQSARSSRPRSPIRARSPSPSRSRSPSPSPARGRREEALREEDPIHASSSPGSVLPSSPIPPSSLASGCQSPPSTPPMTASCDSLMGWAKEGKEGGEGVGEKTGKATIEKGSKTKGKGERVGGGGLGGEGWGIGSKGRKGEKGVKEGGEAKLQSLFAQLRSGEGMMRGEFFAGLKILSVFLSHHLCI